MMEVPPLLCLLVDCSVGSGDAGDVSATLSTNLCHFHYPARYGFSALCSRLARSLALALASRMSASLVRFAHPRFARLASSSERSALKLKQEQKKSRTSALVREAEARP